MNSGSFYRDGLPVISCPSLDNLGSGQNALNSSNNSAAAGTTPPLGSSHSKPKQVHYDVVLNEKLDSLIGLAQRQMEETESIKGDVASLRAEVIEMKEEMEKQPGPSKRKSVKLPTDLSVSATRYVHAVNVHGVHVIGHSCG